MSADPPRHHPRSAPPSPWLPGVPRRQMWPAYCLPLTTASPACSDAVRRAAHRARCAGSGRQQKAAPYPSSPHRPAPTGRHLRSCMPGNPPPWSLLAVAGSAAVDREVELAVVEHLRPQAAIDQRADVLDEHAELVLRGRRRRSAAHPHSPQWAALLASRCAVPPPRRTAARTPAQASKIFRVFMGNLCCWRSAKRPGRELTLSREELCQQRSLRRSAISVFTMCFSTKKVIAESGRRSTRRLRNAFKHGWQPQQSPWTIKRLICLGHSTNGELCSRQSPCMSL